MNKISRRKFIKQTGLTTGSFLLGSSLITCSKPKRPNVVFVFADQWRAESMGFAGNMDVKTPNLDRLAAENLYFEFAISCMPVSTPFRGSLLTGQYAHTNGLFLNDVQLDPNANTIGKVYKREGYDTAYIGKWHVNGNGRSKYIPKSFRQGFDYFKVLECTHNYQKSPYYDGDDPKQKIWEGYDAYAQTVDAQQYIQKHTGGEKPFVLFLSWGPPHNPYAAVPQKYLDLYKDKTITLRPNVPNSKKEEAISDLKGYYAHIAALDECIGMLQQTIREQKIEKDTIFVFTSDHGDMLGSQGATRKQRPYDESIRVPFILKYPAKFNDCGCRVNTILNTVDIMPTLLGLCEIRIPETVEGQNLAPILDGQEKDLTDAALIECIAPCGEWERRNGGREYRGIRTRRYTYVKDLNGPWLLFDNQKDPYQMKNLLKNTDVDVLKKHLDNKLMRMLDDIGDHFLPSEEYIKKWNYKVNKHGTIPYIS